MFVQGCGLCVWVFFLFPFFFDVSARSGNGGLQNGRHPADYAERATCMTRLDSSSHCLFHSFISFFNCVRASECVKLCACKCVANYEPRWCSVALRKVGWYML